MAYEEFKTEYTEAFTAMMSYSPDQVGAGYYAEKMADLAEEYPAWAEQVELEAE